MCERGNKRARERESIRERGQKMSRGSAVSPFRGLDVEGGSSGAFCVAVAGVYYGMCVCAKK